MSNELSFSILNFGFAALAVLLLFYVLCSKEALSWVKPISILQGRIRIRRRPGKSHRLTVQHWEETIFSSIRLSASE